jgi:hypothetical protein
VSLILEALKKLDREKQAPERGFVVVASQPWATSTRNRGRAVALVFLGLVIVAGAVLLARPRAAPTTRQSPLATPTATPAAVALATSPPTTLGTPARAATPRPAASRAAESPRPVPSPRAGADSPPALVLQAISERDGKPIALVSDRLVREGDEFDGVRVVRIGETEVEIEWRGRRSSIRF